MLRRRNKAWRGNGNGGDARGKAVQGALIGAALDGGAGGEDANAPVFCVFYRAKGGGGDHAEEGNGRIENARKRHRACGAAGEKKGGNALFQEKGQDLLQIAADLGGRFFALGQMKGVGKVAKIGVRRKAAQVRQGKEPARAAVKYPEHLRMR